MEAKSGDCSIWSYGVVEYDGGECRKTGMMRECRFEVSVVRVGGLIGEGVTM